MFPPRQNDTDVPEKTIINESIHTCNTIMLSYTTIAYTY